MKQLCNLCGGICVLALNGFVGLLVLHRVWCVKCNSLPLFSYRPMSSSPLTYPPVFDKNSWSEVPVPPPHSSQHTHAHKLDQELVWWQIMCFVMLVVFFPILDACLLLLGSCNPGWLATETGSPRLNTVALHIKLTVWGIYFTLNFYS